jgi:hypothetical protein
MVLLVYALLVNCQEGNKRLSPKYLLRLQPLLHLAPVEYGYGLARARLEHSLPWSA